MELKMSGIFFINVKVTAYLKCDPMGMFKMTFWTKNKANVIKFKNKFSPYLLKHLLIKELNKVYLFK